MRTRNLIFSVFTLLLFASFAYAQVSGVVVDDFGPVSGAIVTVDQTGVSTETGDDGAFSVNASVGNSLTILNPNTLAEKNFNVTGANLGTLNLTDAATVLTDVITLGYSTTTEEAYTGTADVVDAEAIERKNVSNVSQALAGEAAGVRVITTSGQPGDAADIRIRGIGSVNGNISPLIVVDGVPFDGGLASINPADIENTVILKDATATAIYGTRGANGVVVINTKKGRKGKSEITFESKTGFNMQLIPRYNTIKSPEQYIELSWEALKNYGALNGDSDPAAFASANLYAGDFGIDPAYNIWNVDGSELIDPTTGIFNSGITRRYTPEDWAEYGFSPGIRTENSIRFSGGSDQTTFYASLGYLDEKGYIINSDYDRLSTRLNLDHEVNDWMQARLNLGYSFSDQNRNGQSTDSGSIFWFADNIPSIYPLFEHDADGNIVQDPIFGGGLYDYGFGEGSGRGFGANTNAIADATYDLNNRKRHEINTSVSFIFDIFKDLKFETRFGSQYWIINRDDIGNPYYGSSAGETGGSIGKYKYQNLAYNMLEMFTYTKTIGDNHNFEWLAAHENNYYDYSLMYGGRSKMILPDVPELDNAVQFNGFLGSFKEEVALESYFTQLNYNFAKKYYLTGTFRKDGTSRFLNDKWGDFWSVGGAWILSREDFMTSQKTFDFLKLKSSYGITGEQAAGADLPGLDAYTGQNLYSSQYEGIYDFQFEYPGSPNLTWEESNMFQVGAEMGLFNRIDLNLDYYRKNTNNLYFQKRVAPSVGYAITTVNDGELLNTGFEFDLSADIIKPSSDAYFNFRVNGELPHQELLKMPLESNGIEKSLDQSGIYGRSVGHSVYDFYMREWAGVDPETGAALWNQYYDDVNNNNEFDEGDAAITNWILDLEDNPDANIQMTTTTNYNTATQKYVDKSAIPDIRGAFMFDTGYKNFSLSVQFLYSIGGWSYDGAYAQLMDNHQNGTGNWHQDILTRWQQPGDVTNVPRLSNNYETDTRFASASTRFLTKSSYLSLNNVRLGYNFPENWIDQMGMSELNLYVSGDNLWLMTEREGFNPSTNIAGSSDTYRYSPLSTITFGARIKF